MMPDKTNLELILEIFQASERAQVAAGIVIGLGVLYFVVRWIGALFKDLRELLPAQDEKEKKKTGEVEAITDDKRAHEAALIAAQAAFIDDQRALIIALTATSKRVRSLDDTIPMRDELLNKLSDESEQLGE